MEGMNHRACQLSACSLCAQPGGAFSLPLFSKSHYIAEIRKDDADMLDIVCVTANCPKERGYVLRGGHSKIEAILGV
jgi:hypothetical protein